jgi:hypothetical protein
MLLDNFQAVAVLYRGYRRGLDWKVASQVYGGRSDEGLTFGGSARRAAAASGQQHAQQDRKILR